MRFLKFFIIITIGWTHLSFAQNYDDQAKKIDSKIKNIQQQQKKDLKNKAKVQQQLKKTNRKLKSVDKQLNQLSKDLKTQLSLVEKLKNNSVEKKALSSKSKTILSSMLVQHSKQQKPNFLQMLLSQENTNEYDRQQTYLKYFTQARQQQIDSLRIDLQNSESTSQEYADRQKKLKQQYEEQKKLQKQIAKENKNKNQLLKKLETGIAEQSSTIKKLKADKKRLAALIQRLEEKRKAKAISNKQFIPVKGGFTKQKGRLILPVSGKIKVNYGQKNSVSGLRSNGLQVQTSKSVHNVRAIYEGRVIFSNWLKGFGNLIIIEHGGGYISLYGNNQALNKKEGDVVAAREVIATYNPSSNQVNFYFEMRQKGKTINPTPWFR